MSLPGLQPEVYDNIAGTGAVFWSALAAAVNQGQGPQRGPSQFVIASAGGATIAPSAFSIALGSTTSGSDGAANVTATRLVGADIPPRSGMYALRGQGCGIAVLADADDPNYWTTQAEFGLEEGIYMILTGPAGDTIQNAVTVKQQAGLDSYAAKLMFGDWLWWSDQVNGTIRLVSPQGFAAGTSGEPFARTVQSQQATLQCHRQSEIRHPRLRSECLLLVGRSGRAAGCGHRRHQQSAARRQFLGSARRA